MRIIVFVFFYFKCPVLFFQFYSDVNIYIHIIWLIFIIFYITAAEFSNAVHKFSLLINQCKNAEVIFLPDFKIIRTKSRSSMNDTCSIFCSYKITGDHSERLCTGSDLLYLF